ncbi:receptor-like protein 6 [Mangifera indica]|uniref:receptor-like protein 6 n=1 Tax=Mangifera indica TaxID=29780 RepID=UPI001CFA2FC9|nr:receptor-like protein 6 [Mangifera indica]
MLLGFATALIILLGILRQSWKEGTDCCLWDGVTCDTFTGHVIGLDLSSSWLLGSVNENSSLFLLHHLQKLNLACNDFLGSQISARFSKFTKLTHLNLSYSNLFGLVPTEMFLLSHLISLDLSNYGLSMDQHGFNKLLQNLTEIRYLHLNSVDMSTVSTGSLVNLSSSLISLNLRNTQIQGKFPKEIFLFPFLQGLILSTNRDITGNLPKFNKSSPLKVLDLSLTSFSGKLPETFGNLMYLNYLSLSHCNFQGSLPPSLGNITKITFMDLSSNGFAGQVPISLSKLVHLTQLTLTYNNFSGKFPDVLGNLSKLKTIDLSLNNFSGQLPTSVFNLNGLLSLDFSYNQFQGQFPSQISGLPYLGSIKLYNNTLSGRIPAWLFTLPSLMLLDLSHNKLTGPIEQFQQPGPIYAVDLRDNEIHGPIPDSIFQLLNLVELALANNNFSGNVQLAMLSELKNLTSIDLSYNALLSLTGKVMLPQLKYVFLSSCSITEVPIFSGTSSLQYLDLSNNTISGRISPLELGNCSNLYHLNLSHNLLTSVEYIPSMVKLQLLDLSSNLLQGQLVDLPTQVLFFSASNNDLTGVIPPSFCNLSAFQSLDLSHNGLSGNIPECLVNSSVRLSFLNLAMNNFRGSIESLTFPNQCGVTALMLNDNQLQGPLPSSLVNCQLLNILDVGNNRINDSFPNWLVNFQFLQVLVLRSNQFHGPIDNSSTRFLFIDLRVLDLSHNQFSGILPGSFFNNFEAMMSGDMNADNLDYLHSLFGAYYSVTLFVKGVEIQIEKILSIFTSIDISNNLFEGGIPKVIGQLKSLRLLNLSRNSLTGEIPSSLRNLSQLESLDLSSNQLLGKIPMQLTSLTFLSVLNLSYNHLVGHIPEGNQFNTFQNDSYIGNLGLCGSPLSNKCDNDEAPPMIDEEENNASSWFDWKIALMGYGSGFVIGISIACMVFSTGKPLFFLRLIERVHQRNVRWLNRGRRRRRN